MTHLYASIGKGLLIHRVPPRLDAQNDAMDAMATTRNLHTKQTRRNMRKTIMLEDILMKHTDSDLYSKTPAPFKVAR